MSRYKYEDPRIRDTIKVDGAGPIGNPLRLNVKAVTDRHVRFSTAMGDGQMTRNQWKKLK